MKPSLRAAALCLAIAAGISAQNIYSNGPLVTHPGGGFGGGGFHGGGFGGFHGDGGRR